jgi:hypothetical protein
MKQTQSNKKQCIFQLPKLTSKQREIVFATEKLVAVSASPQTGKTWALVILALMTAMKIGPGKNVVFYAPFNATAMVSWDRIKRTIQDNLTSDLYQFNEQYRYVDLNNAARIWVKSADNVANLFGMTVHLAILDEAALISSEAWSAILSRTTNSNAPIYMASNLQGNKNWYWNLTQDIRAGRIRNSKYISIDINEALKDGLCTQDTIDLIKSSMPESRYNELYLLQPQDDSQNPFGLDHINACIVDTPTPLSPIVSYGVDLGRLQDYTVILGLSRDSNLDYIVSKLERTQASWQLIKKMIQGLVDNSSTYTPICIDSTGLGDPIVSDLERTMDNLCPYKISMKSKTILIEGLILAIQSHHLKIPRQYSILIDELKNFGQERLSDNSSYISYKALGNGHDDCIIGLALAYYIAHKNLGNYSLLPSIIDINNKSNDFSGNNGWININGQDDYDSMYY